MKPTSRQNDGALSEDELKRALLVGIDDYPGSPLTGCVADAKAMGGLLDRNDNGDRNYDVRVATSDAERIDRSTLRALLRELFDNSRNAELLFYFAGHGAQTPWGAELVTQDYSENNLGISVNDVLALANESPAREVVIVLDSCFSGDLGNIPGLQPLGLSEAFAAGRAILREGITVLAASQATETAAEAAGHGAFTRLLLEGLEGAAADHLGMLRLCRCTTSPRGHLAPGSSGLSSSPISLSCHQLEYVNHGSNRAYFASYRLTFQVPTLDTQCLLPTRALGQFHQACNRLPNRPPLIISRNLGMPVC